MSTRAFSGLGWSGYGRNGGVWHFGAWSALRDGWRAHRSRRALLTMDDRMLADLGISRADAWAEARRAPWDLQRYR